LVNPSKRRPGCRREKTFERPGSRILSIEAHSAGAFGSVFRRPVLPASVRDPFMVIRSKLYLKFLTFIIPLVILAVTLPALLVTEISRRSSLEQARDYHALLALNIDSQIRAFLHRVRTTIEGMGTFIELGKMDSWERMLAMHGIRDKLEFIHFISLMEPEGTMVHGSSPQKEVIEETFRNLDFGPTLLTDTVMSSIKKTDARRPVMHITTPIRRGVELRWILFAEVDVRHLWEVFSSLAGLPAAKAELLEPTGRILASNNLQDTFELSIIPFPYLEEVLEDRMRGGWVGAMHRKRFLITAHRFPEVNWIFTLYQPYDQLFPQKNRIYRDSMIIGFFMISVCLTVGLVFIRNQLKPIQELKKLTAAISRGNFSDEVRVRSRDEVGQLAAEFDDMRRNLIRLMEEERRAAEEKARLENLAAVGEAAAKVTHQIGNHLSNIGMSIELYREDHGPLEQTGLPATIERNIARIDVLCRDFLRFTRAGSLHKETLPLESFLRSWLEQEQPRLEASGVHAQFQAQTGLPALQADPGLLEHALANLLSNALDAMPEGGALSLSLQLREDRLVLDFMDSGPGVPVEDRTRIFDSFYTTKRKTGTGLGLSIVRAVIDAHGGDVECVSNPSGGHFRITLPCLQAENGVPSHSSWIETDDSPAPPPPAPPFHAREHGP